MRLVADYGSDHELLVVKFRLKWKKKCRKPLGHSGMTKIKSLMIELWIKVCDILQESVIKTILKKNEKRQIVV